MRKGTAELLDSDLARFSYIKGHRQNRTDG